MRGVWRDKPVGEILRLEYGKPLDEADRKPDGLYPVYGAMVRKTEATGSSSTNQASLSGVKVPPAK
jgi:hypothetical protein